MSLREAHDPRKTFLKSSVTLGKADAEVSVIIRTEGVSGSNTNILFFEQRFSKAETVPQAPDTRKRIERTRRRYMLEQRMCTQGRIHQIPTALELPLLHGHKGFTLL